MSRKPEARIVSWSMTVTAAGASLTGCDSRDTDSTTGRSSRKSDSVTSARAGWAHARTLPTHNTRASTPSVLCDLLFTALPVRTRTASLPPCLLCIPGITAECPAPLTSERNIVVHVVEPAAGGALGRRRGVAARLAARRGRLRIAAVVHLGHAAA